MSLCDGGFNVRIVIAVISVHRDRHTKRSRTHTRAHIVPQHLMARSAERERERKERPRPRRRPRLRQDKEINPST